MPGALLDHAEPRIQVRQRVISEDPLRGAWRWSALLAGLALLVHGYHPFSEDAAIYVPAIKKHLDASLYPRGSEFFLLPARFSVFSDWVALSARLFHVPLTYVLLGWYLVSLTLLFAACWHICTVFFEQKAAALWGTASIAALLTLPVANSSLLISDPYLTSRSLVSPILLWCGYLVLRRRYVSVLALMIVAALFHPLMAAYGAAFLLVLIALQKKQERWIALAACFALALVGAFALFARNLSMDVAYREAILTRPYFFLSQWKWYEIAGLVLPLTILWWVAWRKAQDSSIRCCALAAVTFGSFFTFVALAIDRIQGMEVLARFQPLRSFHLIYILLFLLPVNLALQRIFKRAPAAPWLLLVMVALLMFTEQRREFDASAHIEFPWSRTTNPWREGFDWVRINTPKDAVFALDSDYIDQADEGRVGFRAYAERDALADVTKDGGVAALFPSVAARWKRESHVRWDFTDQTALRSVGATWILTSRLPPKTLYCPYMNNAFAVCALKPRPATDRAGSQVPTL